MPKRERSDTLTSAPISTGIYQPKDVRILKAAISRYVEHASEIKSPDSYRLTGACELDEATNSLIIVVDAFPAVLYEDGCVGHEKIFTEADIAAAARRVIRIDQFTGERPIRQFVQAASDATEAMTLEMLAFAVAGDSKYGEQLREIKRKLDARPAD